MKEICIIEFPSNLGLREPKPLHEPGVKFLPDWFRQHQLHNKLHPKNIIRLDAPQYNSVKDAASGVLNIDAIAGYSVQQANIIKPLLEANQLPFVLGGDCSILTGAALALKQLGNYALFYLDGHTDFMDVRFSTSGGIGGMAASIVTGNGDKKITDILGLCPYIKEDNCWCVGNREYDDEYEDEIRNSTATYFSLEKLQQTGIEKTVQQFLLMVEQKKLDGFWLHIDVDVLDDAVMPCVDSPTPGGLSYAEFDQLTGLLFAHEKFSGVEITILDPELDTTGKYTEAFVQHITACFNNALKKD